MENDKEIQSIQKENSLTKTDSNPIAIDFKNISNLQQLELFANWIAKSAFSAPFKDVVADEDGNESTVVNVDAIITCIGIGQSIGLTPFEAVTFGRSLNRNAVIKCKRGADLGLSAMASLSNIYVWDSNGNDLVYTGIHAVNAALTKVGVKRKVLEDGTRPYYYYTYFGGEAKGQEVDYNNDTKDDFVIVNKNLTESFLEEELKAGKIPILRHASKRALVELTRGDEKIAIPYTIQQAIDAGLYKGTKSDGKKSEGKANWNNHPETHLIKMSIILGGRIIASDILNGIYIEDELPKVTPVNFKDINNTEEVNFVEIDEID